MGGGNISRVGEKLQLFISNHRVRRSNRAARAARLPVKELILFCLIGNWCSRSSLSSFGHNATSAKKLHDMHSNFILQRRVFCWLSASIPCRASHRAGNYPPSRSTALTCHHTEPFGFVFYIRSSRFLQIAPKWILFQLCRTTIHLGQWNKKI